MWSALKPNRKNLRFWQALVLVAFFVLWHVVSRDPKAAFFFGEPAKVLLRIWQWFTQGSGSLEVGFGDATWFTLQFPAEIYSHLLVTLTETLLAFGIGTALGLAVGLWLALSPLASAILDPYIKAANSMPRVILAPIFAMWFGLGIWSKVALAVTLVFFIVFFNVYQGVQGSQPGGAGQRPHAGRQCAPIAAPRCICRRPPPGCFPACTRRSGWPSSAPSSANTWARRAASAT